MDGEVPIKQKHDRKVFITLLLTIIIMGIAGVTGFIYQQYRIEKILEYSIEHESKLQSDLLGLIDRINERHEGEISSLQDRLGFYIDVVSKYSDVTEDAYLHIKVYDSYGSGPVNNLSIKDFYIDIESVPPHGCNVHIKEDPTYFHKAPGGVYRISLETYGKKIGCSWLRGDYVMVVHVEYGGRVANELVTLSIPKQGTKVFEPLPQ